jgi:chemotaxis protein MotA
MSLSTIISLLLGVVTVIISILWSGSLGAFWDIASVFCVIGGVSCVTVASFSPARLKSLFKAISIAFKKEKSDLAHDIDLIVDIANNARRNGLLALEEMVESMDEPFMKKGILLVVDGYDQELLRSIMEAELAVTKQRHADNRAILEQAAAYSPAFGMIGTLIGLINMLKSLDDMSSLGPNMSVALVTTFYGSALANLIFNPLSKRLKTIGSVEYTRKELLLEGIMAIQNGENPRAIREKLNAFLSNSEILVLENKSKAKEAAAAKEE